MKVGGSLFVFDVVLIVVEIDGDPAIDSFGKDKWLQDAEDRVGDDEDQK